MPTVSTNKIGFGYSAIAVSEGGCTIAVYKDRHVYLFPTCSPTIASCTINIPEKKQQLNYNNQVSICKNYTQCPTVNEIEPIQSNSGTEESHGKISISNSLLVNHIKFIFSGQLLFVAGPNILCIFSLEQVECRCLLNIDLFQVYNKSARCCHDNLVEKSLDTLVSIDVVCYRNSVNTNNGTYQLVDIIASYQPQKPVFMRVYFDETSYFIDCQRSHTFNNYLFNLHKQLSCKFTRININEFDEEDPIYNIFYDKNDPNTFEIGHVCTQGYTFPVAVVLTHQSKKSRLIHQAMSLSSLPMSEFKKIDQYQNYLNDFELEYAAELALAIGPKLLCIITITYQCQGVFLTQDCDNCWYKCTNPPNCRCVNVEFVTMPWKNHLPKQIYSHPKIDMFAVLFPNRFLILTNQHYEKSYNTANSDLDNCEDISDFIPLLGKCWFIKYNFIEPIVKQRCFFGAFSGEPLNNYFICNWKTTFSYQIALYDNTANTGISAKLLVLNTSKYKGLSQFVWVPNYRIIVGIGGFSGELIYISPRKSINWAQMIPDFLPISQNIEYVEREDDFDQYLEVRSNDYQYKVKELWILPWEPVSHKLGISNFKFYNIQHILSDGVYDECEEIVIDDKELSAEHFTDNYLKISIDEFKSII